MLHKFTRFALLSAGALIGLARAEAPGRIDWQAVRDQQPKGLGLRLELPKTTFFIGEVIDAKLTFTNESGDPYHMWIGTYDRSGRIRDIAFVATDQGGHLVEDPLRWYVQRAMIGGGLGNFSELGKWEFTLPANQWLRFERPGTYEIFAHSVRVKPGDELAEYQRDLKPVPLVSDKVTVQIVPLSAEKEAEVVGRAARDLDGGEETVQRATQTLRYLDTTRARAALLPLLGSAQTYSVVMAFAAAADPQAEADVIYDAVAGGRHKLNRETVDLYVNLKTASIPPFDLMTSRQEAGREHAGRITQAAANAAGHKGVDYNQTWLVALQRDPGKENGARVELLKVQDELTPEQAEAFLQGWDAWGGEDFLPLVRKAVQAPGFSFTALRILSKLRPEEARPCVIEDIQREKPRYLRPNAVPRLANEPLLALPAGPIPELEPFFRKALAATKDEEDLNLILPAIDRYGTAALLPEVISVYQPNEGQWACELQNAALRFWIRMDRPAGLDALARALDARKETGCYHTVLKEVLISHWGTDALPLVTKSLSDPDPQVVESAIKVLEMHAESEWLEPSHKAAERLSATSAKEGDVFFAARRIARHLLSSERWPLSKNQKDRMEAIVDPPRRS